MKFVFGFSAFAFASVLLATAGCGFFGSRYSTGSGTPSTLSDAPGPAVQLAITGPTTLSLGTCAGPFQVIAKDANGRSSLALAEDSEFQILESSGAKIYLENSCSDSSRVADGQIAVSNTTNNSGTFYLWGVQRGNFSVTATLNSLLPSGLALTYIPGAPNGVRWIGSRTIPTFTCVETSIEMVDATGTLTTHNTAVSVGTVSQGLAGVRLYGTATCRTPVTSLSLPAGLSSMKVWVYSSNAGDFSLAGTPTQDNWVPAQASMTALNSSAPKLVVSPGAQDVMSNECAVFNVDSVTQAGEALLTRQDTTVTITGSETPVLVYPNDTCAGAPIRSLVIAQDTSRVRFSAKAALSGNYDLAASAALFLSGPARLNVRGGAVSTAIFAVAPNQARANECKGPFRVQLKDAAGNETTSAAGLNIALTHDSAPGKTNFYTASDCSSAAITAVAIAPQAGTANFYMKAEVPGSVLVTATPGGLTALSQRVTIQFSSGSNPSQLSLAVTGSPSLVAGTCIPAKLLSLDANGYPLEIAGQALRAQLSSDSTTFKFFSTASCQTQITTLDIAVGATEANVYFVETVAKALELGARNSDMNADTRDARLSLSFLANAPAQLVFEGLVSPTFVGLCQTAVLVLKDAYGNETRTPGGMTVRFDTSSGFMFSSACGSSAVISEGTMPAGTSRMAVAFRGSVAGSLRLIAVAPVGISAAYAPLDVLVPPPTHLKLEASENPLLAGRCARYTVSNLDPDNALAIFQDITVTLSSSALTGIFFSDAACTVTANTLTLAQGRNPGAFYVMSRASSNGPFNITANPSSGSGATLAVSIVAGTPVAAVLANSGPSTALKGLWFGPYSVSLTDGFGNRSLATAAMPVVLVNAGAVLSSRSDGTVAPVVIAAGSSEALFYVQYNVAGAYSLAARAGTLATGARAINVRNLPAIVTSVSPGSGSIAGGYVVTVNGDRFVPGLTATFGGVPCAVLTVSPTSFTCTVGAHAAGRVDVLVTNPNADAFCLNPGFVYMGPSPTFTSLIPGEGPAAGGTPVRISGSNFQSGVQVWLGGAACNVSSGTSNATTINCTTTARVAGVIELRIVNPDTTSTTVANAFRYLSLPPAVTSVSPTSGPSTGGTTVTLTGSGFDATTQVWVGSTPCTTTTYVSPTSVRCVTPAGSAGWTAIQWQKTGSSLGTLANAFNYIAMPSVTSISPNYALAGAATPITIRGTNFMTGMALTIGTTTCGSFVIQSPTQATCTAPGQAAGNYTVAVKFNNAVISPNCATFSFLGTPSLSSIVPTSGPVAGGTIVTIQGTNLNALMRVFIGQAECLGVTLVATNQISCRTAPHTPGVSKVMHLFGSSVNVVSSLTYNYTGTVGNRGCAVYAQASQACGDSHHREWGAAFAVVPAGLNLANGIASSTVETYLSSPKHNPSGAFSNRCARTPAKVNATAFPQSFVSGGTTYQLFTDGNLGSLVCPAYYSNYYSPLIIDLNNEGIALSAPNRGVQFDIQGLGRQQISWPTNPKNSLFVALPNVKGEIESINELFGNNTVGPDGKKAANGFEALAKYDRNSDKRIDAKDEVYAKLRLWSDLDSDGVVDRGELFPLKTLSVKSIDLNYENISERNDFYGNETKQRSIIELGSGELRRIFDIWFIPG